jgi:hypothetical protein
MKVSLVCWSTCDTGEGLATARSPKNKNAASVHSQVLDDVMLESTIKKYVQDTPGAYNKPPVLQLGAQLAFKAFLASTVLKHGIVCVHQQCATHYKSSTRPELKQWVDCRNSSTPIMPSPAWLILPSGWTAME